MILVPRPAVAETPLLARLTVSLTYREKAAIRAAATDEGLSLSAWARARLTV